MVTIYDIADKLGVSHTTVSRALNGREDPVISASTRRRVEEAALEMGYRPNTWARALSTGRTYSIGLLVPSMEERVDPHFAQLLIAVESAVRQHGYSLVMFGEPDCLTGCKVVDGVIILGSVDREAHDAICMRVPCCYVLGSSHTDSAMTVGWSDREGAYLGTRHLLDLGHRSILGLFGDVRPSTSNDHPKALGFKQAVQEMGASMAELYGEMSPDHFMNGYLLMKDFLRKSGDITAIFARNDFLAVGAMRALHEAGIPVPQDMSVVGYNDTILAYCAQPALTSIRTPIAEAGEIAVEHLIGKIEGRAPEGNPQALRAALTVRASSAPPEITGKA